MIGTMHLLPPGKYFVGDPGFVFDDESWEAVLRLTDFFKRDEPSVFNGFPLWGMTFSVHDKTSFFDQNDIEYPVNDSVLAAISIDLIENPEGEEHGTIVDAPNGLSVSFSDGVFKFNEIVIDTIQRDTLIDGGYDLDPADDQFI